MSRQIFLWPALALGAAVAFAQTPPAKVGVINLQSAMVATKDGQRAAAELETKRAPKTKELERKQAEIRSLQDSLNRGGNAMKEEAKAELVRNIDTKTKSFNRELEDAQAEWEQDQNRVLQELVQKMNVVIDKYARDNAYALIVDVSNPNSQVMYASSSIDVTKDIVELYDKNAATPGAAKPPASPSTAAPKSATPTAPAAKPPAAAPPKKQP